MRGTRIGRVTNRNYPFTRKGERESMRLLFGKHGIVSHSFRVIGEIGKSVNAPISTSCNEYSSVNEPKSKILRFIVNVLTIIVVSIYFIVVFICSVFVPCVLIVLMSGSFVPMFIMLGAGIVGVILMSVFKK